MQNDSADRRRRGFEVLAELRDMCVKKHFALNAVASLEAFAAQTMAARGDLDGAIVQLRSAADDAFHSGNFAVAEGVTEVLVETLLARGGEGDVAAAEAAVDRLVAALPHASGTHTALVVLRLRALVARASGTSRHAANSSSTTASWRLRLAWKGSMHVGRGDAITRGQAVGRQEPLKTLARVGSSDR